MLLIDRSSTESAGTCKVHQHKPGPMPHMLSQTARA